MHPTILHLNRLVLSTVHRGNAFEYRSLRVLQSQLSMSLSKVGGKADGGVDLQGWWWLPHTGPPIGAGEKAQFATWDAPDGVPRRRIRVIGQCKAEKKKLGPRNVREMEGVLAAHGSHAENQPVVGLLVSESAFTRSTVLKAISSPMPLFLLHLPEEDVEQEQEGVVGEVGAAVWNAALASKSGLLGGEFEVRWERSVYRGGGRPGLWWRGQKLKSWVPPPIEDTEEGKIQRQIPEIRDS